MIMILSTGNGCPDVSGILQNLHYHGMILIMMDIPDHIRPMSRTLAEQIQRISKMMTVALITLAYDSFGEGG